MSNTDLLRKLIEIERMIGNSTGLELRDRIQDVQADVLAMQRDRADGFRSQINWDHRSHGIAASPASLD